jgi:tol-pal system protein YbgF
VAFLLLCGLSLAACGTDDKKISWEQDKEPITKSIQILDENQKKEADSTKALLAVIDSRLQSLQASSLAQQKQIKALSAQLEERKRAEEQERIETQQRIEEQKRILEKKHAAELKRIKAQKQKQLALRRAKRISAAEKKASEREQIDVLAKQTVILPAATVETEKNAYTAAYLALKSGRFDEASKGFNEQLDLYPDGEYADQAWYWLGETRHAQQAYDMASHAFKYVINNYPKSVKHDAALLKLGQVSQVLNRNNDAIKYYNRLINEYGDSKSAEQAREALARMQNKSEGTKP